MKVGDVVRLKVDGRVGLVIDRIRRAVPDGNPNGDFMIDYWHRVLFGEETMVVKERWALEVISEYR